MDREQRPLLARPQGLLSTSKYSWLVILLGVVSSGFLLISGLQYTATYIVRNDVSSPRGHQKDCSSPKFKKQTLKLIRELPLADIFGVDVVEKFENSDIVGDPAGDGLYCVLDNSFSIARIGLSLGTFFGEDVHPKHDTLLRWTGDHPKGDSDFEFITYNSSSGMYIVGREVEETSGGLLRSRTFDVTFEGNHTIVHNSCVSDFSFRHGNKGFEGAIVVEVNGKSLLLGLCEGNFCRGKGKGKMSGNGRLVAMERQEGSNCRYKTVDIIKLPKEVDFQDYSAITVWNGSKIGIASQENAAIFVGDLNPENLEIADGSIYDLPRNDNCEIKYCNLEGLYFLGHGLLVTVTDSMKSKGKQHFRCREKDESIQVFQIPSK